MKLSGNGTGANTMQASIFAEGAEIGNFTNPSFDWMLTAHGSESFNPIIAQLQFSSLYEANFTVSNVWIGAADSFFAPTPAWSGDYNNNGIVDAADYVVWRDGLGGTYTQTDYDVWKNNFGATAGDGAGSVSTTDTPAAVSEPTTWWLTLLGAVALIAARRTVSELE